MEVVSDCCVCGSDSLEDPDVCTYVEPIAVHCDPFGNSVETTVDIPTEPAPSCEVGLFNVDEEEKEEDECVIGAPPVRDILEQVPLFGDGPSDIPEESLYIDDLDNHENVTGDDPVHYESEVEEELYPPGLNDVGVHPTEPDDDEPEEMGGDCVRVSSLVAEICEEEEDLSLDLSGCDYDDLNSDLSDESCDGRWVEVCPPDVNLCKRQKLDEDDNIINSFIDFEDGR